MTFIALTRWRDGRPLHVEASAIICLSVIDEPADLRAELQLPPATVISLGLGGFSEWVRETPTVVIAAVRAAQDAEHARLAALPPVAFPDGPEDEYDDDDDDDGSMHLGTLHRPAPEGGTP